MKLFMKIRIHLHHSWGVLVELGLSGRAVKSNHSSWMCTRWDNGYLLLNEAWDHEINSHDSANHSVTVWPGMLKDKKPTFPQRGDTLPAPLPGLAWGSRMFDFITCLSNCSPLSPTLPLQNPNKSTSTSIPVPLLRRGVSFVQQIARVQAHLPHTTSLRTARGGCVITVV